MSTYLHDADQITEIIRRMNYEPSPISYVIEVFDIMIRRKRLIDETLLDFPPYHFSFAYLSTVRFLSQVPLVYSR